MQTNLDPEYQRIVENIKSRLPAAIHPEAILLFGSGTRGEVRYPGNFSGNRNLEEAMEAFAHLEEFYFFIRSMFI